MAGFFRIGNAGQPGGRVRATCWQAAATLRATFSEIRTTMTQPNYPPPGDPNPYSPPGGYPPGQYQPQFYAPRKTNSLALTSMIVSICSVALCPLVGIVGAILGHKAKAQIRATGEDGDGMATAGIIVGWVVFGLFIAFIIVYAIIIAVAAANGAFDSGTSSGY